MSSTIPLQPTWEGHVATTWDACCLFEACLQGRLSHVPRRPHDRERNQLIKSGNVFIYEEHASGIKRWTDGVSWSPSRILGNFLIYRELDQPFPPGEKKRALKKPKKGPASSNGVIKQEGGLNPLNGPQALNSMPQGFDNFNVRDEERALIGSLVDSYSFKEEGLIKKTISMTYNNVQHHLVSYYNVEDVKTARMPTPSTSSLFLDIWPRADITGTSHFRQPIDPSEWTAHFEARHAHGVPGNNWMPPTVPGYQAFQQPSAIQRDIHVNQPLQAFHAQPMHGVSNSGGHADMTMAADQSLYALNSNRHFGNHVHGGGMVSDFPRHMPLQMTAHSQEHSSMPLSAQSSSENLMAGHQVMDHQMQGQHQIQGHHHLHGAQQVAQMPLYDGLPYTSAGGQQPDGHQHPQPDGDYKGWPFNQQGHADAY